MPCCSLRLSSAGRYRHAYLGPSIHSCFIFASSSFLATSKTLFSIDCFVPLELHHEKLTAEVVHVYMTESRTHPARCKRLWHMGLFELKQSNDLNIAHSPPLMRTMSLLPGTGLAPVRRSATLPSRFLAEKRQLADTAAAPGAAAAQTASDPVLFFHPSAKIVKFAPDAPPVLSQAAPSTDFDYPVDTIETLPWRSPTERTVAVGRLRLEIPPGLSPFLKCGTVVQAILKNSQCWCVDGVSTFVLRIRSLTYYRIELPNHTPEDAELIESFKAALSKVLRYEVTPCPFRRGFSVPLPAEAHIPKKKRAWRPKTRRESAPAGSETSSLWPDSLQEGDVVHFKGSDTYDGGDTTDDTASTTSAPHTDTTFPEEITPEVEKNNLDHTVDGFKRTSREPAHSVNDILAQFQPMPESDSEDETKSSHSSLTKDPESPSYQIPTASPTQERSSDVSGQHRGKYNHQRDTSNSTIVNQPRSTVLSMTKEDPLQNEPQETEQHDALPKPTQNSLPLLQPPESEISTSTAIVPTGVDATQITCSESDRMENVLLQFRRTRSSRKRDISPLPPVSTLQYSSPRSSENVTRILFEKACSLVIILPIQLFLFFLRLASQIVSDDSSSQTVPGTVTESRHGDNVDRDEFEISSNTPGSFHRSARVTDLSDYE